MAARASIVVIDDEADVSRYLAAALSDRGFEVHTARDAEEGLRRIREVRPDLVCLDLVLPGRTGLSLYRELRELVDLQDLPVVVVTGVAPQDAEQRLGLRDPDAYLEKPVDLPEFVATVERLVRGTEGTP